jgi:hypothetical protein
MGPLLLPNSCQAKRTGMTSSRKKQAVLAHVKGLRIKPLADHFSLIEQIVDVAKLIDAHTGLLDAGMRQH